MRLLVAFSPVIFVLTMSASAYAGCGDYVILTGELPSWMSEHDRQPMTHGRFDDLHSQRWQDSDRNIPLPLPSPAKCNGPGCQPTAPMMTDPVLVESQQRIPVLVLQRVPAFTIDERESFQRPLNSSLSRRLSANRLDRPPQFA